MERASINSSHTSSGAGSGAHDAAECHSRLRVVKAENLSNERSYDHNEYGLNNASCDGNSDNFRRSTECCAGNRSYNECCNACADGYQIDWISVSQRISNSEACEQADEFTDEQGQNASYTDFLISSRSAPNAVETMAKSLNIAPPTRPMPAKSGTSAIPLWPPVIAPPI